MARRSGINVVGYHHYGEPNGTAGMSTCGQMEIGGFSTWCGKDPQQFIEQELFSKSYQPALNLIFSLTSTQLKAKSNTLIEYLLNHKNTRVMHWYKNDAHGPNWIFLCIYHHTGLHKNMSPGYDVADIQARLSFDANNGWKMK